MGHKFGELSYIRGIVRYSLSPFEQRAFAGALTKGVPNVFRRIKGSFLRVVPPFVIAYLVYTETEKRHDQLSRKNPADYANDV